MTFKLGDRVMFVEEKTLTYDKVKGKVYEIIGFTVFNDLVVKRNGLINKGTYIRSFFRLATQKEIKIDRIKIMFESKNM